MEISKKSIDYLSNYVIVNDYVRKCIDEHIASYGHKLWTDNNGDAEICAYYEDREDFVSDWSDIGYSEDEALKMLEKNEEEFQEIDGFGILRYTI